MILQVMELLRQNLNTFLSPPAQNSPEPVVLGNIAYATPDNANTPIDESAQVYMTLVNIEEELTIKNGSAVRQSDIRPFAYVNPPLYLNLYILFAANHQNYSRALQQLGRILLFFQSNRTFSLARTPVAATDIFVTPGEAENNIKITLDLMTLTFEQINHLWGTLGGKQMPSLLFKARTVEIDANRMLQGGGIIEKITIN